MFRQRRCLKELPCEVQSQIPWTAGFSDGLLKSPQGTERRAQDQDHFNKCCRPTGREGAAAGLKLRLSGRQARDQLVYTQAKSRFVRRLSETARRHYAKQSSG